MLLEVSQTEKYKYCIILFIGEVFKKKANSIKRESENLVARGGGIEELCIK